MTGPTTRPGTRGGAAAFLSPALLAVGVCIGLPLVSTLVLSTMRWDLTSGSPEFVGAANYVELFVRQGFVESLLRTLQLVVLLLPFATVVPMALAIALWLRPGRASALYRAVLFLPMVLAPVATAVTWQFLLNPLQGVANASLALVGLPGPNWLGDPVTAPLVIALITAGRVVALNVLLFGAALDRIDRRTIDAARLDGATTVEIVRHVVLPHLLRTTSLLAGVCAVLAGQWAFTNVAVLTQGGPSGSTDNVYNWIYTTGFTFFDVGAASAGAVLLVLVLGAPLAVHAAVVGRRTRPVRVGAPVPAVAT